MWARLLSISIVSWSEALNVQRTSRKQQQRTRGRDIKVFVCHEIFCLALGDDLIHLCVAVEVEINSRAPATDIIEEIHGGRNVGVERRCADSSIDPRDEEDVRRDREQLERGREVIESFLWACVWRGD